jgi:hypothetical protein
MFMVSDAENSTVGLVGDRYELYYRNWDIANVLESPAASVENRMIPDLHLASARFDLRTKLGHGFELGGRLGLQHQRVGDRQRLEFHRRLYPDGSAQRWFVPVGARAGRVGSLGRGLLGGLMLEVAADPPHPRELYIAVRKLGDRPWWSGNPDLAVSWRGTLRGRLVAPHLQLDLFVSQIWDHVHPVAKRTPDRSYLSYANVDARLLGLDLRFDTRLLDVQAVYSVGRNVSHDAPLAEIRPLTVRATATTPRWRRLAFWLRHIYAGGQRRVDASLDERATPAWNRFDVGVGYRNHGIGLTCEVENVGNEPYHEHLSYLRDPFAAGVPVRAPGRSLRVALHFEG